jgi:ABC-2 type transport system permease protein
MNDELRDIGTIMWKEWREIFAGSGIQQGWRGLRLVLLVGIISILLPLRQGASWVDSPLPIFFDAFYIPFALLITTAANAFAGERERHTLETLLASRLSDKAILLGKIAALSILGWLAGLFGAVLQLIVVNVTEPGQLHLYSGTVAIGIAAGSLLLSTVIVALGNLLSQRASTVQQAQQMLTLCFFLLAIIPFVVFELLSNAQRADFARWVATTSPTTLLLWGVAILVAVDAVAIGSALVRFRRTIIFQTR